MKFEHILWMQRLNTIYAGRIQLTGSQFFGDSGDHSDVDFFTDNKDIDLSEYGFDKYQSYNNYMDDITLFVWRIKGVVDVQVVSNYQLKLITDVFLKAGRYSKRVRRRTNLHNQLHLSLSAVMEAIIE
jgi:hypothetical protein